MCGHGLLIFLNVAKLDFVACAKKMIPPLLKCTAVLDFHTLEAEPLC